MWKSKLLVTRLWEWCLQKLRYAWRQEIAFIFICLAVAALLSPLPKFNFLLLAVMSLIVKKFGSDKAHAKTILHVSFFIIAALTLYACSTISFPKVIWTYADPPGYFNQLTQSFLSGHLYMPQAVDPRILTLPDPYLPAHHNSLPYPWDLSYFRGHYYMYWGIAPILTFTLPFRLIMGKFFGEFVICLWFAGLALLAGYSSTVKLLRIQQQDEPGALQRILIFLSLLFSSEIGIAIHQSDTYSIAIFAGVAYFLLSLHFALSGYVQSLNKRRYDLAAGIFMALAVASRPTFVFGVIALIGIYLSISGSLREKCKRLLTVGYGALPVFVLTGVYNQLRFDNPFQFGFVYQFSGIDMKEWTFHWSDTIFSTASYIFNKPEFLHQFPYINIQPMTLFSMQYRHRFMNDAVCGIMFVAPVIMLAFFQLVRSRWQDRYLFINLSLWIAAAGILIVDTIAGNSIRYSVEIITAFLVPALAAVLAARNKYVQFIAMILILLGANLGFFGAMSIGSADIISKFPKLATILIHLYRF